MSDTTRELRFVSWNVNGLRAVMKKDPSFPEIFAQLDADVFAIQETKLQEGQVELDLPGYHQTWSYAERKGYSGTAVFSREEPLQVMRHIGCEVADDEGRVCALEFDRTGLWTCTPPTRRTASSASTCAWSGTRGTATSCWGSRSKKPVVTCGDFNVAHHEIDLKNPGPNRGNAGFSDEERESFGKLLDAGFTDTFRALHPDVEGAYSWWSYRLRARENNAGWRIDYFLVSDGIADRVTSASILDEVLGSDHCPVALGIRLYQQVSKRGPFLCVRRKRDTRLVGFGDEPRGTVPLGSSITSHSVY